MGCGKLSVIAPAPVVEDPMIQLFVKTINNRSIAIKIDKKSKIEGIKTIIHDQEGIERDSMRLIYSGKQLDDAFTLQDYNILEHSVIHLVLRLKGGGIGK